MPDEIDLAAEQAERWLQQNLDAQKAKQNKMIPKGRCYYCDEIFEGADSDKKLFCNRECADDYEEEQKLKARR